MAKSSSDLSRNLERLTFAAMLKSTCSPGLEGSLSGSSGRAYRTMSAFLLVASLVRTCLLLARGRVWEAPGPVFGGKCCGAFAWLDRDGLSWRTWQHSLDGGWEPWLDPWPRAGIAWNGIAYRQVPSAPLTRGTGCGLWPTPNTVDAKGGTRKGDGQEQLCHQVEGSLEPGFVEFLMGYPLGWTLEKMDGRVPDWSCEWPDVPRVSKGAPHRVARLRALGNAVVPACVAYVMRWWMSR